MGVVKGAVGCAVLALLLGHELSSLDPVRRAALWAAARAALGAPLPDRTPPRAVPMSAPQTSLAALGPAEPSASAAHGEGWIAADGVGRSRTAIEIDGQRLAAFMDTGTTFVALSAEDADRIGLRPAPSDDRDAVETANGRARVAEVQIASVRLGGIELREVTAPVGVRGQLGETLLGMSFLPRVSGVRFDRGRLVLTR